MTHTSLDHQEYMEYVINQQINVRVKVKVRLAEIKSLTYFRLDLVTLDGKQWINPSLYI